MLVFWYNFQWLGAVGQASSTAGGGPQSPAHLGSKGTAETAALYVLPQPKKVVSCTSRIKGTGWGDELWTACCGPAAAAVWGL